MQKDKLINEFLSNLEGLNTKDVLLEIKKRFLESDYTLINKKYLVYLNELQCNMEKNIESLSLIKYYMEGDFFSEKDMEKCISNAGESLKNVEWSNKERDFIKTN